MTILNQTNDGRFNFLIVLHRVVAQHGSIDRERLLTLCSSGGDGDNQKYPSKTLLRWTQLGLFLESEDGRISLSKGYEDPKNLPSFCREVLFRDENNQNFWDSEGTRAADFTRGLAFILCQDIYSNDFNNHPQVQSLEGRQIGDESRRILGNDTRWNGLRAWSEFLGFFWSDPRLWPDPTSAIREELAGLFGAQQELTATAFIERIAERIPVLDQGRYRLEVERALDTQEWQAPARPNMLSTSLSRALWRLSRPGGPLRFEERSDAGDGRILQRSGGREWPRFTHVLFTQGN